MSTFLFIAIVMVVVALGFVLLPLLRGTTPADVARDASNVAILREQRADLDGDLERGAITRQRYDQARAELETRVLEESRKAAGPTAQARPSQWTAAIIAALIPIGAGLGYLTLGNPAGLFPGAARSSEAAPHDVSPQQIETMIATLVAKLEKEPNDADGWITLARSYYSIKKFDMAVPAFERAVALVPDNAELLADFADAIGANQRSLEGRPRQLIERALKIDPRQWKALGLAGTAAFDRKDYKAAVMYWERLKASVPPEVEVAQTIDESIAEARAMGGLGASPIGPAFAAAAPPVGATPAPTPPMAPPSPAPAGAGKGGNVAGTVRLAPALAGKAAPTDTVFVFARAATGPRMPLAILRKQVKDLPITFALDDSMAMSPAMKLSSFPDVVIGARVSKSGNALPQSGDLEGLSAPVKIGARDIAIVIANTVP